MLSLKYIYQYIVLQSIAIANYDYRLKTRNKKKIKKKSMSVSHFFDQSILRSGTLQSTNSLAQMCRCSNRGLKAKQAPNTQVLIGSG